MQKYGYSVNILYKVVERNFGRVQRRLTFVAYSFNFVFYRTEVSWQPEKVPSFAFNRAYRGCFGSLGRDGHRFAFSYIQCVHTFALGNQHGIADFDNRIFHIRL